MKTIHKYTVPLDTYIELEAPEGSEILKVAEQFPGELYVWMLVDTEKPLTKHEHHLVIVGTGNPMPEGIPVKHLDSIVTLNGAFVWHIFTSLV